MLPPTLHGFLLFITTIQRIQNYYPVLSPTKWCEKLTKFCVRQSKVSLQVIHEGTTNLSKVKPLSNAFRSQTSIFILFSNQLFMQNVKKYQEMSNLSEEHLSSHKKLGPGKGSVAVPTF